MRLLKRTGATSWHEEWRWYFNERLEVVTPDGTPYYELVSENDDRHFRILSARPCALNKVQEVEIAAIATKCMEEDEVIIRRVKTLAVMEATNRLPEIVKDVKDYIHFLSTDEFNAVVADVMKAIMAEMKLAEPFSSIAFFGGPSVDPDYWGPLYDVAWDSIDDVVRSMVPPESIPNVIRN